MSQNLIQKQHQHPYPEDNRQSTTNSSINKGQNGFRFQFINKILHNNHPITTHQNIAMRPIKLTKIIDHNQAKKSVNAKDILKKTILREPSISSFGQRTGDNFLMKGRMLQGFRKPIQYQMQSFLLSINERIIKQMQKSSAGSQLPTLSKYNVEYQKINSQNIIENIKKMHSRRISQKSSVFNITARINNRNKNQSQMKQKQIKNQTISYSTNVQNLKKETTLTSNSKLIYTSNQNRMEKQAIKKSFVKGYLYYDDEAKQFLKQFRGNMLKTANSHNLNQNQITAKTYMVVDCTTLTPLYGKNIKQNIEIASISKVMTCYLTIMICKKYDINMCTHLVRVSEKAAEVPGTTAQLQAGDILTVYQLLLGLMLPSGNDASVAIAQSMGKIIQKNKKKQTNKTYYQTFITHMNLLSKQLELDQTWSNSSGLSYYPNYSSAEAIIVLTSIAIKNKIFNEIVCCKSHQIQIKNDRYGLNRRLLWKNTNKLLEKGWAGVKTGTTQAAGHCLMARKENILVCVFNCQSLSRRFSECLKLYEFYKSNQAQ